MVRDNRWHTVIAAIVMVGLAALACGPLGGVEAPTPTPTLAAPVKGLCGDGVCDEAEQANPDLCPGDCATPLATPAPTKAPAVQGRCGDGTCDGPENRQNCPQDCAESTAPSVAPTPPAVTGVPDYEPPINVFMVLHIDPNVNRDTNTFEVTPFFYQQTHDEIDWLMEEGERHGMHLTFLYNGWYTKWALEHGDTAQFQELVAAGDEIGSHAHRITYDPAQDLWVGCVDETDRYGHPNYDAALTQQCWEDADRYMDEVVAEIGASGQNQIMCAVPFKCSDEGQLMEEFGFTVSPGNRSEKGTAHFGHLVWNPWRPAASDEFGHELEEDLTANYISVDHLAQIGSAESHGTDLTVRQLQRRFLMLYVEWLARERTGAEDKVWVFGFADHPNYGDQYNAEIEEFLSWLDEHFIGKESAHGNIIAQYATIGEIAGEYKAWEGEHPGTSSFSYVVGDPYPYTYATVPRMLEGAAYEAHVDVGQGVSCFCLSKGGGLIYMMWSDVGERTVDLSGEVRGQVRVTNAAGEETVEDASALSLTEEPLFVEPL